MSGTQFAVTPKLPAQITGVAPIVVTKSGLAYTISLGAPVGSVTKRQWFSAVATLYNLNTVLAAVNANANDPAWIQWNAGYTVAPADYVANITQSSLALTSLQMTNLFTLAGTLTP